LLADVLTLSYQAIAYLSPMVVHELTQLLQQMIEKSFVVGIRLQPGQDANVTVDFAVIFEMVLTMWEPELNDEIEQLRSLWPKVIGLAQERLAKQIAAEEVLRELTSFRQSVLEKLAHQSKALIHLRMIAELVENWLKFTQNHILAVLNVSPQVNGLEVAGVGDQVQHLIGQVEGQLRSLIVDKYGQQFGSAWIQHVEAKHKAMFARWLQNIERDRSVYKTQDKHAQQLIEYARFEDLTELITAQWQLFRAQLDLGYAERNKTVFYDKMNQIAQVRNPLAHHRTIPENELFRARVLCNDILFALQKDHQ
jgi:hypothetical protein